MSQRRIYTPQHFDFFNSRITEYEKEILAIIGEEEVNKQYIIDECPFSKTVVHASVEALFFAGLLDLKIKGRKNIYYLSDDGIAFAEYLLNEQEKNETEGTY